MMIQEVNVTRGIWKVFAAFIKLSSNLMVGLERWLSR